MWIGLDIGTTAVKAAAYRSDGSQVASAQANGTVVPAANGGMQQDMEGVWSTCIHVLQKLTSVIDVSEIFSLGVSAQGDGMWPIKNDGQAVSPALLWNDTRGMEELSAFSQDQLGIIGRGCGTALWPGTSAVLWKWFEKNQPKLADEIQCVATCADWIGYKLTGELAIDHSNASIPFLDIPSRSFSKKQFQALECERLEAKTPKLRRADEQLGEITKEVAHATGLPEGLAVNVGTLDLSAMIVGMGLDKAGQAMMIMGTTAVVNILRDNLPDTDFPVGASVAHPTSSALIRVLAPTSGASAFDWFAKLHPKTLGGESASEIAAKLNSLVTMVPAGSNGVMFLPYLNGERAPFVAPEVRGSFVGMSSSSTKADLGRSVMEGTAFSLRHCIDEEGELPDGPLQLTGGGSRNPVWTQIIADIVNRPIAVSEASDQGLWGAACLGASAAGAGKAIELSKRDENLTRFEPNESNVSIYSDLFEVYKIHSEMSRAANTKIMQRKSRS